MDTIERLAAWLEKPNYEAGVLLYERTIGEGFVLSMLKGGSDDYNRDILEQALTKQYEQLLAEQAAKKAAYPEPLVEALQTGGLLMDERTILKERMRTIYNSGISEGEELKTAAFRILAIKDELDRIYGQRHFFEHNGFMAELASVADAEQTPADLLRRRNNLRTYVSKYEAELVCTFDPSKRQKIETRLAGFRSELQQTEQLLKSTSIP